MQSLKHGFEMANALQCIGRCHSGFAKGTEWKVLFGRIHALQRTGHHFEVFLNQVC